MKKTLITLLALTGVVIGEDEVLFSVDRDNTAITLTEASPDLSLTFVSKTYATTGNSTDGYLDPVNEAYDNTFSPNVQLMQGKSDSYWAMTFTVKNDSAQSITLTSISFDFFCLSGGGADKGPQGNVTCITSLLDSSEVSLAEAEVSFGIRGETNKGTYNIENGIEVGSQNSATFTIKVSAPENANTYAGLKSGSVTYTIPEPATATLSLLALAGLAARRRRK